MQKKRLCIYTGLYKKTAFGFNFGTQEVPPKKNEVHVF